MVWTEAGLWRRLHRAVLDELGAGARWTGPRRSSTRPPCARKGGSLTGPNPVDRGKKGSKLHVLSDAQGIPLAVAVSGANTARQPALKPLIRGYPPSAPGADRAGAGRSRLRADKAYYSAEHLRLAARAWARPAHRPSGHRVRRTPRSAPLEDRTVDLLALRLPPPDRPIRTKGRPLPRLPRPRRRPDLLQEARETHHVRHPLTSHDAHALKRLLSVGVRPAEDGSKWYENEGSGCDNLAEQDRRARVQRPGRIGEASSRRAMRPHFAGKCAKWEADVRVVR